MEGPQGRRSGFVEAAGTRLHYYRSGDGSLPLILVHGISDDGSSWPLLEREFREGFDIVMPDLRGHGKSDAPEGGYSYGTMARELAALIIGLGLEKPIVLGRSLGGMIALSFAGLFPAVPRALIAVDPPPFWAPADRAARKASERGLLGWLEGVKRKTRDELLADSRANDPRWDEAERGPWADAKHRFSPRIAALVDSRKSIDPGLAKSLRNIGCPTLLVYGDRERGGILGQAEADSLMGLVPGARGLRVAGAGHCVERDDLPAFLSAVRPFLAAVLG
jgi:N-formylmaleamate deformylase